MKKFLLLLLPIALVPTITACQDKAHSIPAINVYEENYSYIDINRFEFEQLLDRKQSFLLEYYGDGCGHCKDLGPLLEKYVKETHHLFYRFNLWALTEVDFNELEDKYGSDILPDGVPTLRFFKDGFLTYEVNANKHSSYTALKKILDKHFITSKIQMVTTLDGFTSYTRDHNDYVAYVYDIGNKYSVENAAKFIINNKIAEGKKDVLLLNKPEIAPYFTSIKTYYDTELKYFACKVEGGEIKKTIDIETDGDRLEYWFD